MYHYFVSYWLKNGADYHPKSNIVSLFAPITQGDHIVHVTEILQSSERQHKPWAPEPYLVIAGWQQLESPGAGL